MVAHQGKIQKRKAKNGRNTKLSRSQRLKDEKSATSIDRIFHDQQSLLSSHSHSKNSKSIESKGEEWRDAIQHLSSLADLSVKRKAAHKTSDPMRSRSSDTAKSASLLSGVNNINVSENCASNDFSADRAHATKNTKPRVESVDDIEV